MFPSHLLNRPFLPFATERLTLRPLKEEDAIPMRKLANDIRVAERLARLPHPYDLEDAHKFIAFAQAEMKKGKSVHLAVIRREDQTFMGVIGLEEEAGYWLGFDFWGQGYGKEAMKGLVHFAFFALQQAEIKGKVLTDNTASRRIFEGLGFENAGETQSSSLAYEGKKPSVIYVLSRKDFLNRYNAIPRPLVWVVAAALINERGELLMAERPRGVNMAGVWELPGGKMEANETPEQTLIRELKEELRIDVKEENCAPLGFSSYRYEKFHLIMPFYLCRLWEGVPHGAEGQKLAWLTYSDLAHIPLPPADILPAHRLADTLKGEGFWK